MASKPPYSIRAHSVSHTNSSSNQEDQIHQDQQMRLESLPKVKGWPAGHVYQYQGFWYPPKQIHAVRAFQEHFLARDSDIVIVTKPKSGTTWLKALAFAIVNRNNYPPVSPQHPLLTSNPHELVPCFEYNLYTDNNQIPDLSNLSSPRLFGSHIPYECLPMSIKTSNCKLAYIYRNPADTVISTWHFINASPPETTQLASLDQTFDSFCMGTSAFGPFWKHILGYWNESLERPNKVLCLRYEDLKGDIISQVKRLAGFLEYPFSDEEESEGVVEEIAKLCSFEKLSNLEVNKMGQSKAFNNRKFKTFFRKGEAGDSLNYLSPLMFDRLNEVIEKHFHGSGLTF